MIAALFVERGGVYFAPELAGKVDPWDETRDARLYPGPWPVVAHPPCARWCRLAGFVERRWPEKRRGDDGGCFASALASVRRWGGVLEHPAYSDAWAAHDLPAPPTGGGWVRDISGGWSCYVEQLAYGHPARKPTWLYAFGTDPPTMRWGFTNRATAPVIVGRLHVGGNGRRYDDRRRLTRDGRDRASVVTPPAFRDALLDIARRVAKVRSGDRYLVAPEGDEGEDEEVPPTKFLEDELVKLCAQARTERILVKALKAYEEERVKAAIAGLVERKKLKIMPGGKYVAS